MSNLNPGYYKAGSSLEVINIIREYNLSFCLGNVIKYVCRAGNKDKEKQIEDLQKAVIYLQKEIEYLQLKQKDNE